MPVMLAFLGLGGGPPRLSQVHAALAVMTLTYPRSGEGLLFGGKQNWEIRHMQVRSNVTFVAVAQPYAVSSGRFHSLHRRAPEALLCARPGGGS